MDPVGCPLAQELAKRLRSAREEMTRRWLDRISERASMDPEKVFPTAELLDHVPILMDGIADYMENPADQISADDAMLAKAMELGELRLSQGFGAHEILKEYEILGGVLFAFLTSTVDDIERECSRSELLACAHRLFQAIAIIQQITTTHYLRVSDEGVREREERLRAFNRLITHELKNRISAVAGATEMLGEPWIARDEAQRERFLSIAADNVKGMEVMLKDILLLTRTDPESRRERHIQLPAVAAEAARQLLQMAKDRGVEIRISGDLPGVDVDSAAVELCLVNYLSNGIKYADPRKSERWVEVRAHEEVEGADEGLLIVEVRDNGLGVPPDRRGRLFERFFRAHETVTGVEGTGLGLSIVRETMESLGGKAWAEFDQREGAMFKFSLPTHRERDTRPREELEDELKEELEREPT